jgi:hypothetical protein
MYLLKKLAKFSDRVLTAVLAQAIVLLDLRFAMSA